MRYKFRYFNGIYKTAAKIAIPLQNFFIIVAAFWLFYYLVGRLAILIGIDNYLLRDDILDVFLRIMYTCSILWAAIYCFFKKGVFLYDDHLTIARYTVTLTNWKNRIFISYDEIEKVNVNYTDLHFTRYHFMLVVPGGDESYNIELTLKSGKKYFFSIEDQEEFCENLNLLLESRRQKFACKSDDDFHNSSEEQ